jgi:quercetin dioxygenase-like cupin family protein
MMILALSAAVTAALGPAGAATPMRTPLATVPVAAAKSVDHVQVIRVDFAPGQVMPRHLHPVPVVCYVEAGAFHVEIAGRPPRDVAVGAVTYEPPDTPVEVFRNTASTPGVLICDVLAGAADAEISRLLPPR